MSLEWGLGGKVKLRRSGLLTDLLPVSGKGHRLVGAIWPRMGVTKTFAQAHAWSSVARAVLPEGTWVLPIKEQVWGGGEGWWWISVSCGPLKPATHLIFLWNAWVPKASVWLSWSPRGDDWVSSEFCLLISFFPLGPARGQELSHRGY